MKIKKICKILPQTEMIRIWGDDEEIPVYSGLVANVPNILLDHKLTKGPEGSYIEIRYGCSDIQDHVAVFLK